MLFTIKGHGHLLTVAIENVCSLCQILCINIYNISLQIYYLKSAHQAIMGRTVHITAVRTVTWPGDVTDLQGSVTEGVKLDGQELRVIRVMFNAHALNIEFYIHETETEIRFCSFY